MRPATTPRVLALAPATRHLGLAFFEGEELARFGVKPFLGKKTKERLVPKVEHWLDELLAAHRPNTLVVEEAFYAQAQLSPLLQAVTSAITRWGRRRGLRIMRYLPTTVKEHFCEGKKTRRALAEAMVCRYPFLSRFLKVGHAQRTQEYWQQMFEAVALGALSVTESQERWRVRTKAEARARGPVRVGAGPASATSQAR